MLRVPELTKENDNEKCNNDSHGNSTLAYSYFFLESVVLQPQNQIL